ncbi:uncharacterized protein [Euwallacea similis]|uniref:uncharacterized protein n=1 Tax=Euwallacea similis TaxID=1736056 RepID=UPI003450648D
MLTLPHFGVFVLILKNVVLSHPAGYEVGSNVDPILTPFSQIGDAIDSKINQAINAKAIQFVSPFPDTGRKSPILESPAKESLPIQADIKYAKLQQFVADVLNPKPIVDTIEEYEKYGNDAGNRRAVSTKVVNAFEGFSNVLNAVIDTPSRAAKTVGRQITKSLNQLGGKLVGLA